MSAERPAAGSAPDRSRRTLLDAGRGAVALLFASAVAIGILTLWIHPGAGDVRLLALYLGVSGSLSLALGYAGLQLLEQVGFGGLGLRIAYGQLIVIVVALVNVGATAWLMFLSVHDFALLGSLLVFAATLALFISIALARSISSAVQRVTAAARQMAAGDLRARAVVSSRDELGTLADAFNHLASELQQSTERERSADEARRELIAAVSHDLRTPLASIRAMVEAINDGVVADPETIRRYLKTTQSETERLAGLIDDLFELSQIDGGRLQLGLELGSLHDLISDTLQSLGPQAAQRGVRLVGTVDPALPAVRFDPARIQRVLDNLVGNAIRYTPPGGVVEIRGSAVDDQVRVIVHDTGEGIPQAEQEHIFERFYRGERSRERNGAGAGLGLTIARGIVSAHGGRIWVESAPGAGATFVFTLPRGDGAG
jgi:signal transduction histidine kinase